MEARDVPGGIGVDAVRVLPAARLLLLLEAGVDAVGDIRRVLWCDGHADVAVSLGHALRALLPAGGEEAGLDERL